jgi:hypothetical protein
MKNNSGSSASKTEKTFYERNIKKAATFKSPDINKLQEVVIDHRTRIYIALDASPERARIRYFERLQAKEKPILQEKKPIVTV